MTIFSKAAAAGPPVRAGDASIGADAHRWESRLPRRVLPRVLPRTGPIPQPPRRQASPVAGTDLLRACVVGAAATENPVGSRRYYEAPPRQA